MSGHSTDSKSAVPTTSKPLLEYCQRCQENEEYWKEEIELRDAAIKELRRELASATNLKPSPLCLPKCSDKSKGPIIDS